jgi:hypothetical protein
MKKLIAYWMSSLLVALPSLSASASAGKDAHRLRNSDAVLKETLDVPDYIPQNLLDKAECVAGFPSVLENTFGGSMVGSDVL